MTTYFLTTKDGTVITQFRSLKEATSMALKWKHKGYKVKVVNKRNKRLAKVRAMC
jgi:hypothetical protein